ncbi:MAG TPA: N-acylneuraminate cytidylyltransferase [Bacteroidales bacterium]|nr:N-acylneuraminate cytidylyltransferase [Bacteroidales bacterium]
MSIVAFVPIRSASKSIKNKNIKPFYGKPLIYWVLNALQNSLEVNEVVVALDSDIYAEIVRNFGLSKIKIYNRKPENAIDTASTESVMLEYLSIAELNNDDLFILAQATSPLTISEDIDSAVRQYLYSGKDSLLSCVKTKRFFWNADGISANYDFRNRPRRQDFNGMFMENGAFYINKVKNILANKNRLSGTIEIYEMPEYTALELDEPTDWKIGEILMAERFRPSRPKTTSIQLLLSDVDGVLTDGGMYYTEKGDEIKKFCTSDGIGFKLLQEKGIKVGIITSEDRNLNRNRAKKLGLDYNFHAQTNKIETVQKLCKELNIGLENIAYIGDDINDFELLCKVGLAACPANAVAKIKNIPGIIQLQTSGGEGAVREFAERIIANL